MVIFFHLLETYSAGPAWQIINHGYLAVDFFFVLSGFVIGYAYDDRWNRMSTWGFFKRRLVRLQPMVIMGTVLGACLYFFGQGEGFPLIGNVLGWKVILAFVMGCLMIPCGPKMDIRGWGETNSFNGPNWAWSHPDAPVFAHVMVGAGCILLSIGTAYACLKLYDMPIRKWLTDNCQIIPLPGRHAFRLSESPHEMRNIVEAHEVAYLRD